MVSCRAGLSATAGHSCWLHFCYMFLQPETKFSSCFTYICFIAVVRTFWSLFYLFFIFWMYQNVYESDVVSWHMVGTLCFLMILVTASEAVRRAATNSVMRTTGFLAHLLLTVPRTGWRCNIFILLMKTSSGSRNVIRPHMSICHRVISFKLRACSPHANLAGVYRTCMDGYRRPGSHLSIRRPRLVTFCVWKWVSIKRTEMFLWWTLQTIL